MADPILGSHSLTREKSMNKWWTVLVLLCVCVVGTAHAQSSNRELLETVWDYTNPEHQKTLRSLAYERAKILESRSQGFGIPYAEARAYKAFIGNTFPHRKVGTELEWKIHFHIFADLSELSPAYFGGPLKIKDRVEKESSGNMFTNIFKETWNYKSPGDREELPELIIPQVEEEWKQLKEDLRQRGVDIEKGISTIHIGYPLDLKDALVHMAISTLQIGYANGEEAYHSEDEAWLLLFTTVESISYWTKEFYGESIFGTDIILG